MANPSQQTKGSLKPNYIDLQAVKCYRCSEFRHMARDGLKPKKCRMGFAVHKTVGTNALEDLCFYIVDRSTDNQPDNLSLMSH